MISLIPSYSLEDFSLYRSSTDVDEIFSAWSVLYHPALVAKFNEAPRWEAAGSPSSNGVRHVIVVPPCAEYLVSKTWLKKSEEEGAVVVRDVADRDDILKILSKKLNLELNSDLATESFHAVGLCCLMEELLTRKLRYMSNLDTLSFKRRIVDAAVAHMASNEEEREKQLQKAFDLLASSKEYFFPTATKFLDLTWVQSEDLEQALPLQLKKRRAQNSKTNLVLPVPLLLKCEKELPETLELLKQEVAASRVTLIGSDYWEGPLYLSSPMDVARQILDGKQEYLRVFGTVPQVFGRQEQGYAQILPQILKLTGYRGVLARTGDGWNLLEKSTDRSLFRWQGRDGSTIPALCKRGLDATSSEEILQLPDRIGNSYYSDDASAIVFEHRPNAESRWLNDLMLMDRYSPVIGKFYDVVEYFRVTEGSGDKEKFVKDRFKTNFLTRSVKRERSNPISSWVIRQRLRQIAVFLDELETTLRFLTVKTKSSPKLVKQFNDYLVNSRSLKNQIEDALKDLDARLLPVENEEYKARIDWERFLQTLEESKDGLIDFASQYLVSATSTLTKQDVSTSDVGFLFMNLSPTQQNLFWETRGEKDAWRQLKNYLDDLGIFNRTYISKSSDLVQYAVTLESNQLLWIPKFNNLEYLFDDYLYFKTLGENALIAEVEKPNETHKSSSTQREAPNSGNNKKKGFFQTLKTKLRVDAPNLAKSEIDDETLALAEYVVKKYSPTEIEKYYRLRNDFFEIKIDPVSGSIRRLTTYDSTASFNNGLLRQPNIGNRLAWDFTFKLPQELLYQDARSQDDPRYGYAIPAADSIEILDTEPSVGRIRITGRIMTPSGELASRFCETITAQLGSKLIDVEVGFDPKIEPDEAPWTSYYCCRLAWKDSLAEIRTGASVSLIGTMRNYLQAPECVDIRSDEKHGVTILSNGLPFFKKAADARIDIPLIVKRETATFFRFAIGIDLEDPHEDALAYLYPKPLRLDGVPRLKRPSSTFFSSETNNVKIFEYRSILSTSNDGKEPTLIGVNATLLEIKSANTKATFHSFIPIERVEALDLTGKITDETISLTNAASFSIDFQPRQLRVLNIYFKQSSLK